MRGYNIMRAYVRLVLSTVATSLWEKMIDEANLELKSFLENS